MKRNITIILLTICTFSNVFANQLEKNPPKLVEINGKFYKEINGTLFPLLGVVLKWITPMIVSNVKEKAKIFVQEIFAEKKINILDESQGERDDVEIITINGNDADKDGNIEFTTESEDHNNDGQDDNLTEIIEEENIEDSLEKVIFNQLQYIDQFYQGDIDGDGLEK